MADKPIIFSAPMVRALLDGRKTQTRRVLTPRPNADRIAWRGDHWLWSNGDGDSGAAVVPYAFSDRLWVREALRMGFDAGTPICQATYAADGAVLDLTPDGALYWAQSQKRNVVTSIHMPRWASRLTLTVTDVRVQRVQEISEADARAEGAVPVIAHPNEMGLAGNGSYRDGFRDLWNSLHGPNAWDDNPWVCALTFCTHRCNIDAGGGA